ncbi:MAG: hypothetical protein NT075_08545 [Chloroflexi bacterium]|nr:hypothetical protein [Chloroflexota bacterium]
MFHSQTGKWKALSMVLVASLLLAACGGGSSSSGSNDSTATSASTNITSTNSTTTTAATTSGETTDTGFNCPAPTAKVDVTSKELNLFVWTEYIPQDMIDCFEKVYEVYGIKINRDEYSANEEMYAKLSQGGANYDLVQPTDYIVGLMIRQGL